MPRVDVGQVDVWHIDVRDAVVDVAALARDVEVIEGCVMDGSRAELDVRLTRDGGGKNGRCGDGGCREKRWEIGEANGLV